MNPKFRRLIASRSLGVVLLTFSLPIAGCGGGGKSGSSTGPTTSGSDPYISGMAIMGGEHQDPHVLDVHVGVKDTAGNYISGARVTLSTTLGTIDEPVKSTDVSGVVIFVLRTNAEDAGKTGTVRAVLENGTSATKQFQAG